ncbi:MAG: hypothetical protein KME47_01100 [Nodosilinea sp. WJT8-NPBG4]|nr:hypothetical protein [Nodosilinea sp. WJT8-NPBG4]
MFGSSQGLTPIILLQEPAAGLVRHPKIGQVGIYSHRCISVQLSATLRGVNGTC